MITTVSSAAALNAALKSAQAGDTIQLSAGNYAGIIASNLHFASDVTVTSAPGAQAVLTGLTVSGSSGLVFSHLEFLVDPAGAQNPFQVGHASWDVHFDYLNVHGSMDGNPQNDAQALLIRDSSNVSVTHSEFQQVWNAINHQNIDGLVISGNSIHDIRSDGVHGTGSSNVVISDNSFSSFFPIATDHSDAIQFWSASASAHDITIVDNLIQRGTGSGVQGVFIRDDGGAAPFLHLHISDNLVIGAAYNGIAVLGATNPIITGNYVQGFSEYKSWIRLEYVTGGQVTGNSANVFVTTATDSHITMTSDTTILQATDGGAAALALWQQAHTSGIAISGGSLVGTTLADTLTGGTGNDTITGGGGADLLTGGAGSDTYITDRNSTVVELAGGGIDTILSGGSYTLGANVEKLTFTGTSGAWGYGNALANQLTGNIGGNHLNGFAGADTINGGGGDDTLSGGTGADVFVVGTGAGQDVITDFGANGDHDVLDLSALYADGLRATISESTAGVTLSFTTGATILLQGVHIASLHPTTAGFMI